MKRASVLLLGAAVLCAVLALARADKYAFTVNMGEPTEEFVHYWERCVGSGHASLALRQDWREAMIDSHENLGWQMVRMHGVFDDDMSVVIDNRTYSFVDPDSIYDFLLSINMRPIIELSFMPGVLASGDETVFYYKGNITPPKNYTAWAVLLETFASHLIDRYGIDEVSQWYFEVRAPFW